MGLACHVCVLTERQPPKSLTTPQARGPPPPPNSEFPSPQPDIGSTGSVREVSLIVIDWSKAACKHATVAEPLLSTPHAHSNLIPPRRHKRAARARYSQAWDEVLKSQR